MQPRLPVDVSILHDYYVLSRYWPTGARKPADDRAAWTRVASYFERPLAECISERFERS